MLSFAPYAWIAGIKRMSRDTSGRFTQRLLSFEELSALSVIFTPLVGSCARGDAAVSAERFASPRGFVWGLRRFGCKLRQALGCSSQVIMKIYGRIGWEGSRNNWYFIPKLDWELPSTIRGLWFTNETYYFPKQSQVMLLLFLARSLTLAHA